MACELLAGPTAFINGNAPPEVLTDFPLGNSAFYADGLGLCGFCQTLNGYSIAQLDGTAYLRGGSLVRASDFVLDLQRPGEYLVHESLSETALYEFNKASGTFGAQIISGASHLVEHVMVRCVDRYLYILGNSVQYKPLDLSGAWITEATLSGPSGTATISPTNSHNIIAIGQSHGTVCFYDVAAREQVGTHLYVVSGTNVGLYYSRKHDVFLRLTTFGIGIRTDGFEVYANAVRPASLSNPAALSTVAQARVSEVRVRLLGADADPCMEELVNWSVTAGSGALKLAQSATDVQGYAYNEYVAPVGSTGSVTIQAQVLF